MRDPLGRQGPSAFDIGLYLVGLAGLAAGLTLLYLAMRDVMEIGGSCGEGGQYIYARRCPEGVVPALMLGIFGGIASLFLGIWKGAAIGGRAVAVLLLAWPALFGSLGLNFLQYGLNPPGEDPGPEWGLLICGVVFGAMAAIPLLVGLAGLRSGSGTRAGTAVSPARAARQAPRRKSPAQAPFPPAQAPVAARDPEAAVRAAHVAAADGAGTAVAHADDLVDDLERLATLHRAGALTDDEYIRAKAAILDRPGS